MAITFYATNNFTGDGTTVNWNINFADGYIDTTNVKARYLDNTGSYVDIAISSVAGNVVTISPAVANGQEFQIYRDTEKRFPLVDFSDGAILNETNLDTLATQAVMVSAEAFDQSNNGVRIAGDSLVIAQGIDAKAQEALDNSEAAVATANAIDGKAQTALDSSAAAVVTANAAASTAAGAVNTANTALATANDAADDAAAAITTANGAVTTANAATTTANAASAAASAATTTANNAAGDAANAVSTAGTALSTANTASTNASAAVTTANDAKATAEGIEAKADSALAASATAVSTANSAEATANAIDGKATDALDTADSAVATANSATATANAASSTASSAAADASTALSTANAIDAKAQTALDNTTALDAATMKKAANLSDIADKAAAWLNVRPIGSTPLAADPVNPLDATTRQWVEARRSVIDSWAVVKTDPATPSLGASVNGGVVSSTYSNPSGTQYARLYSGSAWGSPNAAVIEAQGTATHAYKFYEDGTVDFRQSGKTNSFRMHTPIGTWSGITDAGLSALTTNGMDRVAITSGSDTLIRGYSIGGARPDGYPTKAGFHVYMPGTAAFGTACVTVGGDNGKFCRYFLDIDGQIYGSTDYGNFSYTKNGASDYRVKHDISPVSVEKSYSNIQGLEFVEFIYNNDEQGRVRHGIIAQQAETVEPLYVKTRKYVGINPGEIVEQKELDITPMLLDTMHVVQTLMAKVEALEARIAELTSQ